MGNFANSLQHADPERFREPAEFGRATGVTAYRVNLIPPGPIYGGSEVGILRTPLAWALREARRSMPIGEFHSHGMNI